MCIKKQTIQLTELSLACNELCRQALICIFEEDDFIIKTMKIIYESPNMDDPKFCTINVKAFFLYKEKEFDIELVSAVRKDTVWKLVDERNFGQFFIHFAYINSEYSFLFKPIKNLKFSNDDCMEYQRFNLNKLKKENQLT